MPWPSVGQFGVWFQLQASILTLPQSATVSSPGAVGIVIESTGLSTPSSSPDERVIDETGVVRFTPEKEIAPMSTIGSPQFDVVFVQDTFKTRLRLCTKSLVREMTRWSMRPSRPVFKA